MSRATTPNSAPRAPAWAPECQAYMIPGYGAEGRTGICMKDVLKKKFLALSGQGEFVVADDNEMLINAMTPKNIDKSAETLRVILRAAGVRSFKMAEFDSIVSKLKVALSHLYKNRPAPGNNSNSNGSNGSTGGKRSTNKRKTNKRSSKRKSGTRRN